MVLHNLAGEQRKCFASESSSGARLLQSSSFVILYNVPITDNVSITNHMYGGETDGREIDDSSA